MVSPLARISDGISVNTAFLEQELLMQGVVLALVVSGIPLLASSLVGLILSVLQAATQIQDHTLTFVPKLVVLIVIFVLFGPWMVREVVTYFTAMLNAIPYYATVV